MRARGLASAALLCVWLAALPGCDAVKSEQKKHEYVHELVAELCAPGAFYRECWWVYGCYEEMPTFVASALPASAQRIQPSEALRQHVLERVFFIHIAFAGPVMSPKFEKEACMDETRWQHVPPSKVGEMAELRARREERRQESTAPSAPATPPAPAAGTAPAP